MNKEDEFKPFVERPEVAFPSTFRSIGEPEQQIHRWGMQLRDYFAAKALTDEVVVFHGGNKNAIANWCYGMADAMLKAREQ